ncbi:dephospho-CoA kinase [Undibacterium jejuense]|uniref:Dephospho-CoA kinase n=1 Tax=Undibacterium jejuense TaxID=1344949 RepID=A0A923HIH7_9BURK|nr:dephospho-CoA kinase [Undibacterium jejuense]MBC3861379.1 dephospho-CoA kinase [Undibacterium jejuense]
MSSGRTSPYAIGLTGGIGSGKTTIANLFQEYGINVIDTDAIAHQLSAPNGLAIPAIRQEFGDAAIAPNGAMDRTWMRELIFSDSGAKQKLERILHPLIRQECEKAAAMATSTYVIFVVPLLVESGNWRERVNRIAVVDCPEQTQIFRVMTRNNLSQEQVLAIMRAQVNREQRLAAADDIIRNEGDLSAAKKQVYELHQQWTGLAKAH